MDGSMLWPFQGSEPRNIDPGVQTDSLFRISMAYWFSLLRCILSDKYFFLLILDRVIPHSGLSNDLDNRHRSKIGSRDSILETVSMFLNNWGGTKAGSWAPNPCLTDGRQRLKYLSCHCCLLDLYLQDAKVTGRLGIKPICTLMGDKGAPTTSLNAYTLNSMDSSCLYCDVFPSTSGGYQDSCGISSITSGHSKPQGKKRHFSKKLLADASFHMSNTPPQKKHNLFKNSLHFIPPEVVANFCLFSLSDKL